MSEQLEQFYPGDEIMLGTQRVFVERWFPERHELDVCGRPYGAGGMIGGIRLDSCPGEVKLVRRGNIFRRQFGQDLLPFGDYAEEARFWDCLGMLVNVRNPDDGLFYTWTLEQAITGLEAGVIDIYLASTGGPGFSMDTVFYGGYTIDDTKAGARLRAQCLNELRSPTAV